jgi:hypothetical protein
LLRAGKVWKIPEPAVHPAHDRGVGHRPATLGHHLHQIAAAEFEAQIPPQAQNDDVSVEVATPEQFIQTQKLPATHSKGQQIGGQTICTRASIPNLSGAIRDHMASSSISSL